VITLERCLAQQLRAMLRRCPLPSGLRDPPRLRLQTGPDGLHIAMPLAECAISYHQPGSLPEEVLAIPASVLGDIEGKSGSVQLEVLASGKGRASWDDGELPRSLELATVVSQSVLPLPERPSLWQPIEPAFLDALAEAARTAAPESVRLALSRLQLCGSTGQIIATDGRQLLVQGGFSLPWKEDVLIPALPLFASRQMPREGPLALGRTPSHVTLLLGRWTVQLEIDTSGRFPDIQAVIPRRDSKATQLRVSEEDAAFLVHTLSSLPGSKEDCSPITLEVGEQVLLRARGEDSPDLSELVLAHSSSTGPAVRLCLDRRYLRRALQLGYRQVQLASAARPLMCQDEWRTYLFMPLDKDRALAASDDAVSISSNPVRLTPSPACHKTQRRKPLMPRPANPEPPASHGSATSSAPSPPENGQEQHVDLLAEAEALRALLQNAQARLTRLMTALRQQRRQSRALQAAMASLRDLQLDR
jgi:hypothetical protein